MAEKGYVMTLKQSQDERKLSFDWCALATDDQERKFLVEASDDVVTDFGWSTCWEVAEALLNAGRFNDKTNPAIITVKAHDVQNWLNRPH